MAGLVPAIHVFLGSSGVDARCEVGHGGGNAGRVASFGRVV
jgi:hypothetical protein